MKKIILFLLCDGLVMCSACNKAEQLPTTSLAPFKLDVEMSGESVVDDSKYGYIVVGITYNEVDEYWYGCVCMSSENHGG